MNLATVDHRHIFIYLYYFLLKIHYLFHNFVASEWGLFHFQWYTHLVSQPIEISFYQDNIRWSSCLLNLSNTLYRSSHPEVFLVKGVLKICSKFTGEHACRSVISIKLFCYFIEVTLRHGCFLVNLLYIFTKKTSGWLLQNLD